ncbi:hypothetical protein CJ179_36460 [Rhodococcus sp. ACS1]|uniref:hypothetical protein n=1 Tax=Rhodococcus sp. ACS1 TaxID=2028570 RepID=UPI000BB0FE6C|nr:hypothetical protein [Rhodococcus sp. ACS1]PBC39512.1 hypothetical protein CJ179_36460 [Rhodococcus sp. ACS1]
MRHRHTLSLVTWISSVTLILAACSDDSATAASNASSASATSSTAEPDSTVKRITAPPTTSAVAEATREEDLHGAALYLQTCHDALEYFDAFRELADMAGEPFDAKEAADGLLELARTGGEELRHDLEASGDLDVAAADPNEPTWEEIPKADRTEIERAIYAAANDDC